MVVRELTFSFLNIRLRACLTVLLVIHSSRAISALVKPSATKSAICTSLGVKYLSNNCVFFSEDKRNLARVAEKCRHTAPKLANSSEVNAGV